MTLTIKTPIDVEDVIVREAAREGVTPEEYALRAVIEKAQSMHASVPPSHDEDRTATLFAQWAAEDATDDLEELARRQREGDEIMENIRTNRAESHGYSDAEQWLEDSRANYSQIRSFAVPEQEDHA